MLIIIGQITFHIQDAGPDRLCVSASEAGYIESVFVEAEGQVKEVSELGYRYGAVMDRDYVADIVAEAITSIKPINLHDLPCQPL